jgi:Lamin Tail Domain/Secretion system C-terminal sorting domain
MRILKNIMILLIFSFNSFAQDITISEINYKSHITRDCDDWIELYNYGASNIDISNWKLSDTSLSSVPYTFPVGTTIGAGARLVVFRKTSQFLNTYPTVINKIGPFSFKINGSDVINLKNTLGTTIVSAKILGSFGWPTGGDGEGRTNELVIQNQNTNLLLGADWRDGCMGGSPGTAPTNCIDPIIFTEFNYNSNDTFNQGEWVELYNNSNASIDLSGYFMRDAFDTIGVAGSNTYTFPNGTVLGAGGYLVVSNDTLLTRSYHPKVNPNLIIGNFSYNLGNQGELLKLFNGSSLKLQFSVHYNDTIPWPKLADGGGYTLELIQKNGLYNNGTNWETGCKLGSPGGPKIQPCAVVYPLSLPNFNSAQISIFPNPSKGLINFDVANVKIVSVNLFDITGRRILQQINSNNSINTAALNSGVYYLELIDAENRSVIKKIIVD